MSDRTGRPVPDARHVSPLQGAHNFRDLGGLALADGRRIRTGRVFRSDAMDALTDADVAMLIDEYGLRFILDLRDGDEVASEGRGPMARQRVSYLSMPLSRMKKTGDPREILIQQYVDRLDADPILVEAVGMLAHVSRQPTVVYCAAGKDRTGLVVALLLRLLDVPEETVVADYMLTQENIERIKERLRRSPVHRVMMSTLPPEVYQTHEYVIRALLEEVDDRYGGARGWAATKGLPADIVAVLEANLVERAPSPP